MSWTDRAEDFSRRFKLRAPVLLAPMAGVSPPSLSIAVVNAGGAGACGALPMSPAEILSWAKDIRADSSGAFQLNNWIPGPAPKRDSAREAQVREFLAAWGPPVPERSEVTRPNFSEQCEAMLEAKPAIISSIMGLYSPEFVKRMKSQGIAWFANVTTVKEAREAEAAGADVIVAQGAEAGGHRGSFLAEDAERKLVGLFSLLPSVVDAVRVPVVATGGIADGRGVAAAFLLGASAVQIGTGFLRCPEAQLHPAWAAALGRAAPEDTLLTRAFSGRPGRSLATDYALAALAPSAPCPAPYPVQRELTAPMRAAANKAGDVQRMQAWSGQSAALASAAPAADVFNRIWESAKSLLEGS